MPEGARSALIVASSEYLDPRLRQLRSPASDAEALESVLRDRDIGGFEVRTLLNKPAHEVARAVEEFFADRQPDDLLLAHFSCHGIKDENGELHFAMPDTQLRLLGSTAVAANFVNQRINRTRSRRVILLLDCCNAGAFERGMITRTDGGMGIEEQFGSGRGRAVITASNAMEYAFDGGELTTTGEIEPSVFTNALVNGLKTGEADLDQDGLVDLDELYEYVFGKVRAATPHQTPCKWAYDIRGELVIARRRGPVTTPVSLPEYIQNAVDSPLATVRGSVVQELKTLLNGRHQGRALAARLSLERLANDDSRSVSAAAAEALGTAEAVGTAEGPETAEVVGAREVPAAEEPGPPPPVLEPSTAVVAAPSPPGTVTTEPPAAPVTAGAARGNRSGAARLLDAGFIIEAALLCLVGLTILIPSRTVYTWPWWLLFAGSILGIMVVVAAFRQYPVASSILLWTMAWLAVYALSVIGTSHSTPSTAIAITADECIIAAVVSGALCVWILILLPKGIPEVNIFMAGFMGCFAVALVLAAIALHTGTLHRGIWNAVGLVTLAAALGALLTLLRAHRPAA